MSAWIDQIFNAKAANNGGLVRRSKTDVEKYASLAELVAEIKNRKFHLLETDADYLIVCDTAGTLKVLC